MCSYLHVGLLKQIQIAIICHSFCCLRLRMESTLLADTEEGETLDCQTAGSTGCQTGFTGPWQSAELSGTSASRAQSWRAPDTAAHCSKKLYSYLLCRGAGGGVEENPEILQSVVHRERKNPARWAGHRRVVLYWTRVTFCKLGVVLADAVSEGHPYVSHWPELGSELKWHKYLWTEIGLRL